MFKESDSEDSFALAADEGITEFHRADVLYALEWSAVAPGAGGWNIRIDNEEHTRLVSVVAPGSERPTFFIFWKGGAVVVVWRRPIGARDVMEVGRYPSLRAAVMALCPLHADIVQQVNESMEVLYPRSLRQRTTP